MSSSKKRKKPASKKHKPAVQSQGCWDDLKEVHATCLAAMASPLEIFSLLKDKQAVAAARDPGQLLEEAKVIQKDYADYRHALEVIQEQHSAKRGGTDSPDELMYALMIGEKYQDWLHSFETVVTPTVSSIANNLLNRPAEESPAPEADTQ